MRTKRLFRQFLPTFRLEPFSLNKTMKMAWNIQDTKQALLTMDQFLITF